VLNDSRFPIPRKLVPSPTLLHGRPVKRPSRGGGWLIAVVALVGACARSGEGGDVSDEAETSTAIDAATGSSPGVVSDEASNSMSSSSGAGDGDLGTEDAGLDGTAASGDDAAETADAEPADATVDAADTSKDATVPDAAAHDAAPIADANAPDVVGTGAPPPPTCAEICKVGCCDSTGACVESNNTSCGASGAACHDCTAAGRTCQAGSCVMPSPPPDAGGSSPPPDAGGQSHPPDAGSSPPPDAGGSSPSPDAGGPSCQVSSCTNICVPYFIQCCKADDTCGCSLLFPAGPCN
jgi:hypothetical protein